MCEEFGRDGAKFVGVCDINEEEGLKVVKDLQQ